MAIALGVKKKNETAQLDLVRRLVKDDRFCFSQVVSCSGLFGIELQRLLVVVVVTVILCAGVLLRVVELFVELGSLAAAALFCATRHVIALPRSRVVWLRITDTATRYRNPLPLFFICFVARYADYVARRGRILSAFHANCRGRICIFW